MAPIKPTQTFSLLSRNPSDRMPFKALFFFSWALCFCLLLPTAVPAEEISPSEDLAKIRRHLILIAKKSLGVQQELDELVKRPPSKDNTARIEKLQQHLDRLDSEFESLATQLALEEPSAREKEKSDWLKQMEELTMPLLNTIRDITEKPRKIDKLKKKIKTLEAKLKIHEAASRHLASLAGEEAKHASPEDPAGQRYRSRLAAYQNKYDPELVRFNLERARQSLDEMLSSDESIVESATRQLKDFVKNRGRNLLVTIATFFGLWWVLSRIRKWVVGRNFLAKLSPWLHKLIGAAYNVFVLIVCLLASLACLYFFNDWLLISLLVVVLILVAWTSRQYIPKFLQEIKLIVNLGTVREKERLVWQGIPWLVDNIGLNATLVNERLEGGEIRMPLHELVGKHSRPVVEKEPWFPTRTGDWVILADNSYGKVENQTMEQVVLRLKGGELKHYATTGFLAQTPMNISNGFRYCIEFGLDYGIQSRVCEDVPGLFEKGLRKHLRHHYEGDTPDFTHTEVRFDHAGPSSLNLMIIVHVEGRCAEQHEEIRREIQTALVRICNENGLVIPFNQLTVNFSEDLSKSTGAAALQNPSSAGRV